MTRLAVITLLINGPLVVQGRGILLLLLGSGMHALLGVIGHGIIILLYIFILVFFPVFAHSVHGHGGRSLLFTTLRDHVRCLHSIGQDMAGSLEVHSMVVGDKLRDIFPYIIYFGQTFQQGYQFEETTVFRVVIPRENR